MYNTIHIAMNNMTNKQVSDVYYNIGDVRYDKCTLQGYTMSHLPELGDFLPYISLVARK